VARVRSALVTLVALTFGGVSAGVRAQTPVVDTTARRLPPKVDASALHPSQFVYLTTLERDASTVPLGTRTITVAQTTYVSTPAWLLTEMRAGDGIPSYDSLVTDVAALRPIHWSATSGESHLAFEFRSDSAFGGTSTPGGRRSAALAVPPATLVSGAMLETALRLLPLSAAWEDSMPLLSVGVGSNALLPARLAVIGEDRVHVPAGTFDCWVVSVHAEQTKGLYWVTKSDPIVVRSTLDVPTMGGAQLVSALARVSR
jgi:hypothetical protein